MTPLTNQQKEMLFDYCLGLTSELQNAQIQELIFSNEDASSIVTSIKASLSPLEAITPQECPDELAEGTVWRAMQATRTSQLRLNELLTKEQKKKSTAPVGIWRDLFGRLATAAMVVIAGGSLIMGGNVASNYAHQKYWQTKCGSQLAGIFSGLSNYKNDNNGEMPTLATEPGSPWFQVGDQGPKNVSNTRRMWLLVKNGYIKQDAFMCAGRQTKFNLSCNAKDYNDFPSRKLVEYSFRIGCPKSADMGRQVIVSDLNPIFEFIQPTDGILIVNVNDKLLKANSTNHQSRGQNVLFCDGSVQFVKVRTVDISLDDIYTLQNTQRYQGTEMPTTEKDAFLAP